MSHQGESFVQDRMTAGRGAAANGIDPEILELAEGGGGTQTASTASPPSGAGKPSSAGQNGKAGAPPSQPPSQPGLPMGQRFSQFMSSAASSAAKTVKEDVAGSWDTLKSDFIASTGMNDEARKAFQEGSFWDQMKSQFHATVAAGKLPLDAFGVALSPLTGAIDAGADAAAKSVFSVLPDVPGYGKDDLRKAINTASMLMMPEKGGAAAAAKGAAAEGAPKLSQAAKNKAGTGNPELSGEGLPKTAAEPAPRSFDITGEANASGSKLKVTPEIRDQAVSYINGKRADSPIQVSLENLSRDPDLGKTIEDVARFIPPNKIKPDDIRDMNAYSLGLQPDEVMARLVPQIPTDELQGAAGMVVNSAASEFQKMAKLAMEDPHPANQEGAVRAYAYLNDVIGKFRDAGTDLGRGLRSRQTAQSARTDWESQIHQVVADVGPENVDEAIRKAAALPDPKTVPPFVASLRWMGGRDGLLYGWYNYLLSNPATIVKKLASDAGVMGWNTAVRYAAEKFGSGDVRPGEAAALWNGYTGSMFDGIQAAGKALKAGESQFWADYQSMDGKVVGKTDNHSAAPLGDGDATAAAVNYWRSALPTSWIGAADDFAKVINYRAEARSLAYRDGAIKGLSGADLSNHVGQMMNNLPEHLHIQARNAALRNTFQEPLTGVAEKLQDIVDRINIPVPGTGLELPLGRVIMPFVKVPANIVRMAYHNSPLAALLPSQRIREELAAGGASRDLALARMGLGTGVSAILLPFMLGGRITGGGPADPQMNRAWQAAGNKPHALNVGGAWYDYHKVEPIGMHIAALADTVETAKFAHSEDAEQLAWSMAFGMGDALLSKTYMQGMSDFLAALHDPQSEGKYYGDKLVASMTMPQGAAALAGATDPWLRQHYSLMSAIQSRTPGLASNLPPVRDLWGQPVPRDKGFLPMGELIGAQSGSPLANLLSPVSMKPAGDAQPIDKWIWDNRSAFPDSDNGRLGLTRPGQVQSFDTGPVSVPVKLNERQLDRLRELAGNGLKDPNTGLGARDTLNALVDGKFPQAAVQRQWDKAPPGAQALMVLRYWNAFRGAAKAQLVRENADLQTTLQSKSESRVQQLRAPSIGGN